MRDGRVDWQDDRRDLGRRTQPKVDPHDIAVGSPLLQQFDHAPTDAHRRFRRVVALAPRHGGGIEQDQQVNVGRVIQFAAAELAQRENRDALDLCARNALRQRCFERLLDGRVREIGQKPRRILEAELAARSPSATVSATPARRRRSSPSTVSPVASSAWPIAGAAAMFDEGRRKLRRAGSRSLLEMANIPAPGAARRSGRRSSTDAELAAVRRASSHFSAKPPGRSVVHDRPWIRRVDPMVRRISTWTAESSASIFRQHMPASRPH